ncbi:hypothetical protein NFI96_025116, partial [Prochilodus magdalenae]
GAVSGRWTALLCGSFREIKHSVMDLLKMGLLNAVLVGAGLALALSLFRFPYFLRDCRYCLTLLRIGSKRAKLQKTNHTLLDCFLDVVQKQPHKPFIISGDEVHSYLQVDQESNKVAWALQGHRGSTVGLMLGNEPALVWLLMGLFKIGCTVSMLNTNIRAKSLLHCFNCCRASVLIAGAEQREAVCEVLPALQEQGVHVYVLGDDGGVEGLHNLTEKIQQHQNTPVPTSLRENVSMRSPALYIYTSGTTGLPKAGLAVHERLINVSLFLYMMDVKSDDVVYIPLPLYHAAGLMIGLGGAIQQGMTVVLRKKFSVSQFWKDCRKYNVTVIQYIGEIMRYLCNTPKTDQDHQHRVRVAIGNGLRADVWQEFQHRFGPVEIKEFYGASDGNISFVNYVGKVGASGRINFYHKRIVPHALVQYDAVREEPVRNSEGRCVPVAKGETGLLVVKITRVAPFLGYAGNREQTEKKKLRDVFQQGDVYFNSGDLMKIDQEGFIYFQDRVGDTFRWKGENVATTEVTDVLVMLDFIEEANVYGVEVPGTANTQTESFPLSHHTDSAPTSTDSTLTSTDSTLTSTDSTLINTDSTRTSTDSTLTSTDSTLTSTDSTLTSTDSTLTSTDSTQTRKDSTLTSTDSTLTSTDSTLTSTDSILTSTDSTRTSTDSTLTSTDSTLTSTDSTLTSTDSTLTSTDSTLTSTDSTQTRKDSTLTSTDSILTSTDSTRTSTDSTRTSTDSTLTSTDSSLTRADSTLTSTDFTLTSTDSTRTSTDSTLTRTDCTLTSTDSTLINTDSTLTITDSTLTSTDSTQTRKDSTLTSTDSTLTSTDSTLTRTDSTLTITDSTLTRTESILTSTDSTLTSTDSTLTSTESILTSTDSTQTRTDCTQTRKDSTLTSTDSTLTSTDSTLTSTDSTLTRTDCTLTITDSILISTDCTLTSTDSTLINTDSTLTITDSTRTITDSTQTRKDSTLTSTDSTLTRTDSTLTITDSTLTRTESILTSTDSTLTSTDSTLTSTDSTLTSTDSILTSTDCTRTRTESILTSTDCTLTITDSTRTNTDSTLTITDSTLTNTDSTLTRTDCTRTRTDSTLTSTDSTLTRTDCTRTSTDSTLTSTDSTLTKTDSTLTRVDRICTGGRLYMGPAHDSTLIGADYVQGRCTVQGRGHEGRIGMAALTLKENRHFDCTEMFNHVTNFLPVYARPRFIRILAGLSCVVGMSVLYSLLAGLALLPLLLHLLFPYLLRDLLYMLKLVRIGARLSRCRSSVPCYTLLDRFLDAVKEHPRKKFLIFEDQSFSYEEADRISNQVAQVVLRECGVGEGDTVALFLGNEPLFVWIWLGLNKLGCTVAFLNHNIRSRSLLHCFSCCKAKVLIAGAAHDCLPSSPRLSPLQPPTVSPPAHDCLPSSPQLSPLQPTTVSPPAPDGLPSSPRLSLLQPTTVSPPAHDCLPSSPRLSPLQPTTVSPPAHDCLPSSPRLSLLQPTTVSPPAHDCLPSSPRLSPLQPTTVSPPAHDCLPSSPQLSLLQPTTVSPPAHNCLPSSPRLSPLQPTTVSPPAHGCLPSSPRLSPLQPTAVSPDLREAVEEVLPVLKERQARVLLLAERCDTDGIVCFSEKINTASDEQPPISLRSKVTMKSPALYIFTSGTTGLPKAAVINHERMWMASSIQFVFGVTSDDIIYICLPLYHSSGFLMGLTGAIERGTTVVLRRKFSVSQFWKDCRKYNVTVIQYIGETMRYLCNTPKTDSDRVHKVRMAIGNGIREDTWVQFVQRFGDVRICECYGATEANIGFVNYTGKVGATGRVTALLKRTSPFALIRYDTEKEEPVRNSRGFCEEVPTGETGLLVGKITKAAPFNGYANSQQQTDKKRLRNVFVEGDVYFNSGDLLRTDQEGFIYFQDRIGDTFRWKGENVATSEVTDVLNPVDFVEEANVYGVKVPGHEGRIGMAAVKIKEGRSFDGSALFDQVQSLLPSYAWPRFIRIQVEVDVTSTFKQMKRKLAEEGFNPNTVRDPLYFLEDRKRTYVPMTEEVFSSITEGRLRL